jgi:hypothetical protein
MEPHATTNRGVSVCLAFSFLRGGLVNSMSNVRWIRRCRSPDALCSPRARRLAPAGLPRSARPDGKRAGNKLKVAKQPLLYASRFHMAAPSNRQIDGVKTDFRCILRKLLTFEKSKVFREET